MKKLLFLFAGFFSCCPVHTQGIAGQVDWAKTLLLSGNETYVETDADNNIILAASYWGCPYCFIRWEGDTLQSKGSNDHDIFLIKLDPDGKLLWQQLIGGVGENYISGFKVDQQNDIILYILAYQPFDFASDTIRQGYNLVKLDENGQFLWSRHLSGAIHSNNLSGEQMTVNKENEIIVGGKIRQLADYNNIIDSIVSGNEIYYVYGTYFDTLRIDGQEITVDTNNFFIAKFSPQGALEWAKTFEHTGSISIAGLAAPAGNKINIIGNFMSESWHINGQDIPVDTISDQYKHNVFLMQLGEAGQINWVKKYFDDLYADNITTDQAENIISVGHIFSDTYFGQDTIHYNTPNPDFVIFKVDSLGNYAWATNKSDKNSGNAPYFIRTNSHNDIYLSGDINPNTGPIMAKYSKDGELLWMLNPAPGSNRNGSDLAFDQCGNLIQVGSYSGQYIIGKDTLPWNTILGVSHKFIVKFKDQSEALPGSDCSITNLVLNNPQHNQIIIYPNPAVNRLNIKTDIPIEGNITLTIVDFLGRVVYSKNLNADQLNAYQVNIDDFPSGSYDLSVTCAKYRLTGKVLVIR